MKEHIKYTPIESVVYDIYTTLDDRSVDESRIREWIVKGYRKANLSLKYKGKWALMYIQDHKVQLPDDARFIYQIAYKQKFLNTEKERLERLMNLNSEAWNPSLRLIDIEGIIEKSISTVIDNSWKPMRTTSSNFLPTIQYPEIGMYPYTDPFNCPNCNHEYQIEPNGCLLSSLKEGWILVYYASFVQSSDGIDLIPDNENLKDALFHYVMYRYWMSKSSMKEEGAINERNFHLKQYEVLKMKAVGELNEPTASEMENLKNQSMRLLPRSHEFDKFYSKLNQPQNTRFV